MPGVEFAADRRDANRRDYPVSWGDPPGTQFSEQRAAWVAANVAKMKAADEDPTLAVLLRDGQTLSAARALRLSRKLAELG